MGNSLAREMTMAKAKSQYDEYVKRVLAEKQILAWILKNVTTEFADMPIDTIRELIEDEPMILRVKVNPGETNAEKGSRIVGLTNEDKVPLEGVIYYDIRFAAF